MINKKEAFLYQDFKYLPLRYSVHVIVETVETNNYADCLISNQKVKLYKHTKI